MPMTVWVLGLGSAFFFGLALVLTQFGLRHQSALLGALVSIPAATILFWCVLPFFIDWRGWDPAAVSNFALAGALFPAAVTLLTFEANRRLGPNVAGSLGNLAPLVAVGLAILVLGERPSPIQGMGVAVIVVGVTTLTVNRGQSAFAWPLWTLALPIIAALIRGGIQPYLKLGLAVWADPFAAVLIGYTVSSLVVFAVAMLRARGWPSGFKRAGVLWFAVIGLSNGLAVIAMYAALNRGSVTLVSPLVATYPLITLLLSAALLRSVRVGLKLVLGVAGTVAGVGLLMAG